MSERGDLRVNLTGNSSGFTSMLNQSRAAAKKFGDDLKSSWSAGSVAGGFLGGLAGMLSLDGIRSLVTSTFSTAKSIRQLSEEFEISEDSVQRWDKALARAGLESSTFYRSLERVRALREEMRNDPSKRDKMDMLGLSGDALDPSVNDEDFLKRLLQSGASRPQLNAMLGRGASGLKAAAGRLSEVEPDYTPEEIERMIGGGGFFKTIGRFFSKRGKDAVSTADLVFTKEFWNNYGNVTGAIIERSAKSAIAIAKKNEEKKEDAAEAIGEAEYEQLVRDETKAGTAREKLREAKEKLRQAERHGMTPGQAQADRSAEIQELNDRIKYYEDASKALSDADRLKLVGLKTQRAALLSESRGHGAGFPEFGGSARAGLFSSGANFDSKEFSKGWHAVEKAVHGVKSELSRLESQH